MVKFNNLHLKVARNPLQPHRLQWPKAGPEYPYKKKRDVMKDKSMRLAESTLHCLIH